MQTAPATGVWQAREAEDQRAVACEGLRCEGQVQSFADCLKRKEREQLKTGMVACCSAMCHCCLPLHTPESCAELLSAYRNPTSLATRGAGLYIKVPLNRKIKEHGHRGK